MAPGAAKPSVPCRRQRGAREDLQAAFLEGRVGRAAPLAALLWALISPLPAPVTGSPAVVESTGSVPVLEDTCLARLGDGTPVPSLSGIKVVSKPISC